MHNINLRIATSARHLANMACPVTVKPTTAEVANFFGRHRDHIHRLTACAVRCLRKNGRRKHIL